MHGKTASLKSTEKLDRVQRPPDSSPHWPEGVKDENIKKCGREGTLLSKYNQQYHRLFKDVPLEEAVLKVCSCALQRDLLLQGRLYISPNWLCFHASLFGKDVKVVIPVVSVQMIKKHKMARLLPNGLAITTTSRKYVFVSLLSRDSVYDVLRRVCTHLQPSSKKSLSIREFPEEPECESLEVLIPEMKWRKVCPASRSLSLPDNIPCIPHASMGSTDGFFPSRKPLGSDPDGKAWRPSSFRGRAGGACWGPALCPWKVPDCRLPFCCRERCQGGGDAGGGDPERRGAEALGLPAPEGRLRADLPPGRVLILPGLPHLPAGTAAALPELGWLSPWAQVTATWPLSSLLREGCSGC
ncbi:GRAM domain-containing protein 2A isoform X2 [Camelus ferus]|nr:GRAM domain-containing protein 2A isoform X2 [Camelus ferus]XP_032324858.1 GRAM domain-containing protein 2A isoform X2 [Camelus ferus]XP_032324859.1 GRAM domain-containing protein 2A isoform X2 [Camelus ferus]